MTRFAKSLDIYPYVLYLKNEVLDNNYVCLSYFNRLKPAILDI